MIIQDSSHNNNRLHSFIHSMDKQWIYVCLWIDNYPFCPFMHTFIIFKHIQTNEMKKKFRSSSISHHQYRKAHSFFLSNKHRTSNTHITREFLSFNSFAKIVNWIHQLIFCMTITFAFHFQFNSLSLTISLFLSLCCSLLLSMPFTVFFTSFVNERLCVWWWIFFFFFFCVEIIQRKKILFCYCLFRLFSISISVVVVVVIIIVVVPFV